MPFNKSGPLTQDELKQLWKSVVDQSSYASPLLTQPDSGIELIEQVHAQLAASSQAVDQTFQSLYILPWSGQTNDPASGAQFATVDLTLTRSGAAGTIANGLPLRFQPGLIFDHAPNDYSDDGPIQVLTGRRYLAAQTAVIPPGALGPVTLPAVSEGTSAGYNVPLPGTINLLEQPGSMFSNDGASVVPIGSNNRLVLRDEPEVITPDQLGQYVLFTAGSNAGRSARVVAYVPSVPGNGGIAILSAEAVFAISGLTGTFQAGENVTLAGSHAVFVWTNGLYTLLDWTSGTVFAGTITGTLSGATATVVSLLQNPTLVAETGTAAWRILDWVVDLGLQVSNLLSPTGGRLPVLDEIGAEREIFRSNNETDDVYRERVATPADVVSPNAIIRAINRVLVPLGIHACFREVGRELFRGFFYDGDPTSIDPNVAFAYDMDFTVRPADRYKLLLDYTEFRAFFVISVPPTGGGDYGFAYDDSPTGFYDASPYTDFFDGYPVTQAAIYQQLYNSVKTVIAGGVGFDLVLDSGPCS